VDLLTKTEQRMATQKERLSRLMHISWDIQRHRRYGTRSLALTAAWAILLNEEITVHYLTRRLNHDKPLKWQTEQQFALFNQ
jgi:hypothetical protein